MQLIAASPDAPDGLEAFLIEVDRGEDAWILPALPTGFGATGFDAGNETLDVFLQRSIDHSEGRRLEPGWVPFTTYWLLDDDGAVVGTSRLRHELTEVLLYHGGHIAYYVRPSERGKGYGTSILALTVLEGRKRGIERFLLSVDAENVPSIRVIEGNGGVMEDERIDRETGRPFRRYWIS
jgi:predicted acetyltransferase